MSRWSLEWHFPQSHWSSRDLFMAAECERAPFDYLQENIIYFSMIYFYLPDFLFAQSLNVARGSCSINSRADYGKMYSIRSKSQISSRRLITACWQKAENVIHVECPFVQQPSSVSKIMLMYGMYWRSGDSSLRLHFLHVSSKSGSPGSTLQLRMLKHKLS